MRWLAMGASRRVCAGFVAVLVSLLAAAAGAQPLTIGGVPDSVNDRSFAPFGDLTNQLKGDINASIILGNPLPIPRFQQVYDATSFGSSPVEIDGISFFESIHQSSAVPGLLGGTNCSGSLLECGLFTLRLSTTTRAVNDLYEPVDGFDNQAFEHNLEGTTEVFAQDVLLDTIFSNGALTFTGTPFVYDPDDGNLIVDIQITDFSTTADLTQTAGSLFFDATDDQGFPGGFVPYSIVDNWNGSDNSSFGLVTMFSIVPEPSTSLLLAGGLLVLARHRRGAGATEPA